MGCMKSNHALLVPEEVDSWLRLPRGRARRLARKGLLPAIILPDGEVRFLRREIEEILSPVQRKDLEDEV